MPDIPDRLHEWFERVIEKSLVSPFQNRKRKSKEEIEDELSDLRKEIREAEIKLAQSTQKMVNMQAAIVEEERKKLEPTQRRLEID